MNILNIINRTKPVFRENNSSSGFLLFRDFTSLFGIGDNVIKC